MKLKAFTLAEVLITLGIIGVVAAMTIPSLMNTISDTRNRSQFFRTYTTLQQVLKRMEADDVIVDHTTYDRQHNPFYKQLLKYLSNATNCGDSYYEPLSGNGCIDINNSPYVDFRGTTKLANNYFDDGQIILADGSMLLIDQPGGSPAYIYIFVDVNGVKSPNRLGYDLFAFQITDDGLKAMGLPGTDYEETSEDYKYCDKHGTGGVNGMSCADLVLKRPDYFKWIKKVTD